jgi:Amt family ammonium transporter
MLGHSRKNTMNKIKNRFIGVGVLGLLSVGSAFAEEIATPVLDTGATAWMLCSTALVLLMVPGLALYYGGLVRTKNVLGTMMHSFGAMAIAGVLWAVCGYALAFGPSVCGGWIGWDSGLFLLSKIDTVIMSYGIPEYVFAMFQGKFAIITPALIAGAFAERVTFKGYLLFITLWLLLVYCPICHWVWASDGFLFNMGAAGAIDFAGGTVVHISSGVSGLMVALYLGSRKGYPKTAMHPNNLTMTLFGAGLLWVGWFGFNAGSSVSSTLDTARALTVTQVAAATGALTWILIEFLHQKKATSLGMASGIVAGLVAITPAAGVTLVGGAIALGILASCVSYTAILIKNKMGYDDSLDAFGIHAISGTAGAIGLTFLIRPAWMEAARAKGEAFLNWGVIDQLIVQIKAVSITWIYAAVVSLVLAVLVEKIIGFRLTTQEEAAGMDHSLHREQGYGLLNLN